MPTPPTSFGEITSNKCVINNNVVAQNIEKYVDRAVKCEVAGQAGYWNSTTTTLTDSNLTQATTPNFYWKYLTAQEFGSDVLTVSTSASITTPIFLFPPNVSDLIDYLSQKFKRTIAVGDTYTLTVTNTSTTSGIFLATSTKYGEYSPANSNYNGWLGRIINANTSVVFWVRIIAQPNRPDTALTGVSYELVRPNIVYPTATQQVPTNQGSYTAIVNKIQTNTDTPSPKPDPYWKSEEADFYTDNDKIAQVTLNNFFPTQVE